VSLGVGPRSGCNGWVCAGSRGSQTIHLAGSRAFRRGEPVRRAEATPGIIGDYILTWFFSRAGRTLRNTVSCNGTLQAQAGGQRFGPERMDVGSVRIQHSPRPRGAKGCWLRAAERKQQSIQSIEADAAGRRLGREIRSCCGCPVDPGCVIATAAEEEVAPRVHSRPRAGE
jgi:hypothetical protein